MALVAAAQLDLLAERQMDRTSMALALWGDADARRAAGNLRETLQRTRRWEQQSGHTILRTAGRLLLRDRETLGSDLALFLSMPPPDTPARLRLLLELYSGEFLADLDPTGEPLAAWLLLHRASLRERFIDMAMAGVRQVGGSLAAQALQRIEREAPYEDAVAREAMIAAAAQATTGAREVFARFSRRLKADLGTEPEAATRNLLRELEPDAYPARPAALSTTQPGVAVSIPGIPKVLILPPGTGAPRLSDAPLIDAMVDEITFALCRARTFAVFAPHTARQLARTPFPRGNPYGADFVVRTLVSGDDDEAVWLAVNLTSLATHEVLLSETLRVARSDLNGRRMHLAAALGSRLASGVERAERRYYRTTGSASAYVHFLLGTDDIKTLELRSLRRARGHFRQAIKLSPNFVPARAMLARCLCLEWLLLDRNEPGPIREALRLAREASDIDPSEPLAQREVGHALLYLDQFDEGLDALRLATDLGPHHADILLNYADGLIHSREIAQARRLMDRALELNPLPPDQYHWISGTADYLLGDYAAASAAFARMREREAAARFIAAVEAMNGNLAEAHRHRDIFLAAHPGFRLADYMVPQRRSEDREHYLEGLRRAGFR
jgi:DNA-binding SARP family transcriptional activator